MVTRVLCFAILAVLIGQCVTRGSPPVPPQLQQEWNRRFAALQKTRVVWYLQHQRVLRSSPQQYTDILQQMERTASNVARKELQAQGVPKEQVEEQARDFARAFVSSTPLRPFSFQTEYEIHNHGDTLLLRGSEPAFSPQGVESVWWEVLYDKNAVIAHPTRWSLSGRSYDSHTFTRSLAAGAGTPRVRVWKRNINGALYRLPRFPVCITPELVVLLSGVSPMLLYQQEWSLQQEDAEKWVLAQRVGEGELAPFTLRMTFLKSKNGAPAAAEVVRDDNRYREVYRVTSWRLERGVWVPEAIHDVRLTDLYEERREWRLKHCGPVPSDNGFVIPKGMPVADYRLQGERITLDDVHTRGDLAVGYEWKGTLPTEDQLHRFRAKSANESVSQSGSTSTLWRNLPPLLLILIGAYWYWRVRRAKQGA